MEQSPLAFLDHRPYPLAPGPWRMRQRWNELLFAHWPMPPAAIAVLLPPGLEVDTHYGAAWLGVVPFWMDQVETRIGGEQTFAVPGTRTFSELNLRTYVRSRISGKHGVYFFSLDATSSLAVIGARTLFHLPYFFANIRRKHREGAILYSSSRRLTRHPARLDISYRALGPASVLQGFTRSVQYGTKCLPPSQPGTLEHFLTERYCLFTTFARTTLIGEIHHRPWPLQPAEAEIRTNELAQPWGLALPDCQPILHYAESLDVLIWPLRPDNRPG